MTFTELLGEIREMPVTDRAVCARMDYWMYEAQDYVAAHERCEVSIWDAKLNDHFRGATPEEALAQYREARQREATAVLGEIPVPAMAE